MIKIITISSTCTECFFLSKLCWELQEMSKRWLMPSRSLQLYCRAWIYRHAEKELTPLIRILIGKLKIRKGKEMFQHWEVIKVAFRCVYEHILQDILGRQLFNMRVDNSKFFGIFYFTFITYRQTNKTQHFQSNKVI